VRRLAFFAASIARRRDFDHFVGGPLNVSTSLRELQGWGIVSLVHVLGDRRDHFQTTKTSAKSSAPFPRKRKRREIDPDATSAQRMCSRAEDHKPETPIPASASRAC
jgi:DNA-binding transcriptional regulator GbsR (MarR family)